MAKLLLPVQQGGYTLEESNSPWLEAIVPGGLPRTRRDSLDNDHPMQVSWLCNPTQYQYLTQFYRANVSNDYELFLIDLYVDTGSLVERAARFVPGSFTLVSQKGLAYTVSARLVVRATEITPAWPGGDSSPLLNKITLTPDTDGYSVSDFLGGMESEVDAPSMRMRQEYVNDHARINLTWTVNEVGYEYLRDVYHFCQLKGCPPVRIDLILGSSDLQECLIKLQAGTFKLSSQTGKIFVVTVGAYAINIVGLPSVIAYPT